jgi:hypothetical protein
VVVESFVEVELAGAAAVVVDCDAPVLPVDCVDCPDPVDDVDPAAAVASVAAWARATVA